MDCLLLHIGEQYSPPLASLPEMFSRVRLCQSLSTCSSTAHPPPGLWEAYLERHRQRIPRTFSLVECNSFAVLLYWRSLMELIVPLSSAARLRVRTYMTGPVDVQVSTNDVAPAPQERQRPATPPAPSAALVVSLGSTEGGRSVYRPVPNKDNPRTGLETLRAIPLGRDGKPVDLHHVNRSCRRGDHLTDAHYHLDKYCTRARTGTALVKHLQGVRNTPGAQGSSQRPIPLGYAVACFMLSGIKPNVAVSYKEIIEDPRSKLCFSIHPRLQEWFPG